jgi:hypothetical protein
MREVVRSLDSDSPPPPQKPTPTRSGPARRRLRVPLLVAAAVLILGGSAAWALIASSARDTVSVECEIQGSDTIIPSATGDPIADCAAQWQRDIGSPAPPLVAYDNGDGGISVLPAEQTPPSGFTRLPNGETQSVAMVEMQQWLDDYVHGLNSGCYENPTAIQMTQQALVGFGMADWTVQPAPQSDFVAALPGVPQSDSAITSPAAPIVAGPQQCVGTGILDAASKTVALRALSGPASPDWTPEKLAAKLRSISENCLSLDAAAQQVRLAASQLGLSEDAHQYELTEARDDSARCTTIYENVGGTIFLILRGPST